METLPENNRRFRIDVYTTGDLQNFTVCGQDMGDIVAGTARTPGASLDATIGNLSGAEVSHLCRYIDGALQRGEFITEAKLRRLLSKNN